MIERERRRRWSAEEKGATDTLMSKRPTHAKMGREIAAAALVLTSLLAGQSHAASSEWISAEGGAIRLVALQPKPDGSIPAILEIKLEPGWKTYWREPGASGIPPQITLDPAGDVVLEAMRFPTPKSFGEGAERYAGYDAPVAFPLELKRQGDRQDVRIRASVFLGVCEDICIPVQGNLELTVKSGEFDNPLDGARIEKALTTLPEPPSEDFRAGDVQFDASAGVIRFDLHLPEEAGSGDPDLFLAGPSGFFFGQPTIAGTPGSKRRVEVPVKRFGKDRDVAGKPIALTVRAGERSMETTLALD